MGEGRDVVHRIDGRRESYRKYANGSAGPIGRIIIQVVKTGSQVSNVDPG